MVVDFAGASHIGLKRKENQDAYLTEAFAGTSGRAITCLAVADGMGGHEEGQRAANTAIESLRTRLADYVVADIAERGPTEAWLEKLVSAAHEQVSAIALPGQVVGTTLSMVLIRAQECVIGHVGDSRVYALHRSNLKQLTTDQTWEVYATENQVNNPYGKDLRQAIGVGETVEPQLLTTTLAKGDWLLVCSDGLTKMVSDDAIKSALRRGGEAQAVAQRLIDLALQAGGRDNITVCLAHVGLAIPAKPVKEPYRLLLAFILCAILLALIAWLALNSR